MNGKEEEIYDILYKKKEINDKTPKLRTEDEKKKLKNLSYKISKIPKNLIDNIITKFPSLQRKPQTAEERKEQKRIIEHKKRSKESEIERQRRLTQDKECHSRKCSAESDIDKEMRLTKDKITKHKRYTQATQFRAKKLQELIEKRSKECPLERQTRLNKQKEYENEKRFAESEIERQRRLNKKKESNEKRSAESHIEKKGD